MSSYNPFDSFINGNLDTDGFEPISDDTEGEPGPNRDPNDADHHPHGAALDALEASLDDRRGATPPQRDVAFVSSEEAALDAASAFMGRSLTDAEICLVRDTLRNGGGPVELDADDDDGSEDETLRIEQRAQPTLNELFSHAGDDPNIDDLFGEFMDTLPDPNTTSIWESKLDDLQLQLRGLVTNEVYQNFVDGHYPEWMPDANDFATLDAWKRACKQEIVKIKYLISFSISLMTLAEGHLRRTMGSE